jgi:hypothetical protein
VGSLLEHNGEIDSSLKIDDPVNITSRSITHPDRKRPKALVEGNDRGVVRRVGCRVIPVEVEIVGTLG